ncbi:hypothetical protein NQ315_001921 [Exocentrus adspersus]|uniref:Death domain-containing protein n=1 Tax=Exocentrus adspersus TaxID=1586481 RepID=A0AAV8W9V3_9CUCU|nr:hypothetical protein NQ315_001921 [Exocentrus adspersus]
MDWNFEALRIEYRDVLQKSFKAKSVDLLEQKIKSLNKTDVDVKSPLDQTFRDILLKQLEDQTDVEQLKQFVEFSILSCRKGLSSSTMPVVLLGDIFETLTLDTCEDMFNFVEHNVHVWKEELFFTACKNNLLRLCNDLLRRLSRTTATVFCGKILLFLAKFFPFSERSGLNIVSEFNLENITEYGTDPSEDATTEIQSGSEKHVIDFTFYCKFWQLQDFFRNPNQCYTKVQWKLFCSHSTTILNTFHGIKLDYVTSENNTNVGYFAKYLTSQKLLDLQLHDVNFRRSVLLQFLIVFQYLTSTVKFKSESYELKADQKEWIQNQTEKVYSLLKETPPDGEIFAKIVKNILSREELWNSWKNDGCPEIKKAQPIAIESTEKKSELTKPLLGDIIKEANNQGKYYMGSGELTKLWNLCPNNLEACKGKERDFLPSLEEYFGDAIEQLENPTKEGENLLKDGNFGWRALRLLARRSPHFFTYSTTIMNPLSSYLEMMVRKIAHERPGKNQENTQESQQQDTEIDNFLTEEEQGTEDLKQTDQEEFVDDNNPRSDHKNITVQQLLYFSEKIAADWEKLAVKLGYKPDEIEFFKNANPTEFEQARNLLHIWFEDDEDANLDNLLYILEGLEMHEAAEAVRNELNQLNNTSVMET